MADREGWGQILGVCYTPEVLAPALNITEQQLEAEADQLRYLRIHDDSDKALYPAFALTEKGTPLPGLQKVLTWLTEYSTEPTTWAWWLRTPHPDLEDDQTPEQALRAGINLAVLQTSIQADIAVKNSDIYL